MLESLFSVEGEYVYVFDRSLRYVFVSSAGARVLGKTAEDMVGKTWDDLFSGEENAVERGRFVDVIASKKAVRTMRSFTGVDGRTRSYEYVVTPIIGDNGEVELVVSSGRDVTDKLLADARAAQLQTLTQRLAATLSREEIGQVVIDPLHDLLGATASVAYFAGEDGLMRMAAHRNVAQETIASRSTLALDAPVPLATAIRTGHAIWHETRDVILRDYPHLAPNVAGGVRLEALCALPLVFEDRTFGGIAFSFPRATQFDIPTRNLLNIFALQCAQALERTRLFEQERRARERLSLLAETSAGLSRAQLDLKQVLETVCHEVATRLRDSCTLNLVNAAGTHLELAATHHVNADAELGIRQTLGANPVVVGEGSLGRVAATGQPLLIRAVPFEQLVAAAKPEYREQLRRYPIGSLLVVPLRIHQRVIGTLTASRLQGHLAFTEHDQQLVQEIADRAAFAIENARLFEAQLEAHKLRDDFLSIAGHELRTPLTAMQLQIESLHEHARKGTFATKPELLVERLDKSRRHVQRLEQLISQLLDVSQLAQGRLSVMREEVDLRAIVEEIVERFSAHAARAGSELAYEPGPPIIGTWDRGRLDQVITNLVDNALKYGAGKPVQIELAATPEHATVHVRDRGLGVAPEARERIFGRFERAVSNRNYGGLGLGLWISRQIVEAHGGTVTLEDHPDNIGTTFAVQLPRMAEP